MMNYSNKMNLWLGALCIALIDQFTKILALNFLHMEDEVYLNKILSFFRVYNESYIMLDYDVLSGDFALNSLLHFKLLYLFVSIVILLAII